MHSEDAKLINIKDNSAMHLLVVVSFVFCAGEMSDLSQ